MQFGVISLACLTCICSARRVQTGINPNPIGTFEPRTAFSGSSGPLIAAQEPITPVRKATPSIQTKSKEFDFQAAAGTTIVASGASQATNSRLATQAAKGPAPIGTFVPTQPFFLGGAFDPKIVSTPSARTQITEDEVLESQSAWASAIQQISKVYADGGDYVGAAAKAAGELYGYGHSNVLFKPTKAASHPFRPTAGEAMSYFVGCDAVDGGFKEDGGFAINGGKGWTDVKFQNHQIDLNADTAIAMGTYYFTCGSTGDVAKVEYTFGYKRNNDGKVRIFLHHSSVPYTSQDAAASPPVTKDEVLAVQKEWAAAIKQISKTHKEGGDYIKAAADAAGELYAYGHSSVLFKPTKAAEYQFRPTAEEAMSYFVGGNVVDGGYAEDAGFAINGGKGWADCVYRSI